MTAAVSLESVQMATPSFEHAPVLIGEVVRYVAAAEPRCIVDCTVGGGGHARALLEACPSARLIALDRDPTALGVATERLAVFGQRAMVVHAPFAAVASVASELQLGPVDAVLVDLGVSSHQLDTADRGFSFRHDGPLDMRMDPSTGTPVHEVVRGLDAQTLTDVIRDLGEERHARRIARAILEDQPTTTAHLADMVRRIVPRSRDGIDPATRTFQALRMMVNDELGQLSAWCDALPELLAPGGVALAISFHSLEDRVVKRCFRDAAKGCVCPPALPVCVCERVPPLEVVTRRPVTATPEELRDNPRARSAKLRVARRLGGAS